MKILKKENGKVEIIDESINPKKRFKKIPSPHLCWEYCDNAYPSRCPKIRDREKRSIEAYPFIIDGYQVILSQDRLGSFVVNKCSLYKKAEDKQYSVKQRERLERIKALLEMSYFADISKEDAQELASRIFENETDFNLNGTSFQGQEDRIKKILKRISVYH